MYVCIHVTGFAKTVPIGTTIEIHLWLNIKATLSYCPGTPSTWVYRIRQNIRGGKLSRFSRILAKRESFTIESFPSSQLENFIIIP